MYQEKQEKSKHEYIARINRVQDYIQQNLTGDLSLNQLAKIACFSPFYFNRIFKSLANESLNNFVIRIRLQTAAFQLIHNPSKSLTDIAYDTGFSSPAVFSRGFKKILPVKPL